VRADGTDRRCEKAPRFAASRRQIPAVISASFVRDIRLLGFRFSLFGIQGVGGVFAGVRLPRLTHLPTATAGRWSKEKAHRDLSSVRSAHRRSEFTRLCR